jgi:nucleoredoxin
VKKPKNTEMDLLKGKFLMNKNETAVISTEIFRDSDYIGLFFSASWCPSCQTFLPLLKKMHENALSRNIKLEIIYVSSDSSNKRMMCSFVDNHGSW